MNPTEQTCMGIALAIDEGPVAAMDTMIEAAQVFSAGKIPNTGQSRKALDAWGIEYADAEPIHRMFGSSPALKAKLPPGWTFSRRGGGGHHELLDARGAQRLRWHIHGWDPISLSLGYRFNVNREVSLSATEAVFLIYDGPTVIHTIPFTYPHARISDPEDDGTPYYRSGYEGDDEGWTSKMGVENYQAAEDGRQAANDWLDENRPNHRDPMASWGEA